MGKITGHQTPALRPGQSVMRIDPRYFCPTVVGTLLGDAAKAQQKLGWVPEITAHQMCLEILTSVIKETK